MATRAQLTQERSRQRRDDLLTAAIALFAEGGARAVTHRAVARRAGLPAATTTYYFASIEDLLREALAAHLLQWRRHLEALSGLGGPGLDVGPQDAAPMVAEVFAARGPEVAALELSIYLAATRDDALREQARGLLVEFEQLIEGWLANLGVAEPGRLTGSIIALVAGTALRRQAGRYPEDEEAERLAEGLLDLVGAHVLGRSVIDSALPFARPR